MQTIYSTGTSPSSHTYGNVAALIKEMIISKFPRDFFKTIHISSEMVFKEMKDEHENKDTEIIKQSKPTLILKPFFELNSDDIFLAGTPLITNLTETENGMAKNLLFAFIKDRENDLEIKYRMNRDRISFDITLYLSTLHSQLDIFKSMTNHMLWDAPFYINTSLESMIPRSMIDYVAKINNIDISDENNVPLLLSYLNSISRYPITYKMKNASSRDEFFLYYNVNILTTFKELTLEEVNKKGMVDNYYSITFRAIAEFNLPGSYFLIGDSERKINGYSLDVIVGDSYDRDIIPIFTVNNLFNDEMMNYDGLKLYTSTIFKTEESQHGKTDKLDLTPIFTRDIIHVIKQHLNNHIPIQTFIRLKIIKDKILMDQDINWSIDWNNMQLSIYNSNSNSTYRIVLYADHLFINRRILENKEREKHDIYNIDTLIK